MGKSEARTRDQTMAAHLLTGEGNPAKVRARKANQHKRRMEALRRGGTYR